MWIRQGGWLRRAAFETLACVLYYSGLLWVVARLRKHLGRRRLLVLMYHRLTSAAPPAAIVHGTEQGLAPGHFDGHLRVLRWFGRIIPLETAPEELSQPRRRPRTLIAVTFDDGYRDNLTVGLPALQRHKAPATLFPALDPIEHGRRCWWDEVIRLVRAAPGLNGMVAASAVEGLGELAPDIRAAVDSRGQIARGRLADAICARLSAMPIRQRDVVLGELAGRLGCPSEQKDTDGLYVNWDELRRMAEAGVAIGGHTIRHPSLHVEPVDVARHEITDCRRTLRERLGVPVAAFCYPGGYYYDAVRRMVADAGYRVAVTVERGVNYAGDDPLQYSRIGVSWEAPRHLALKLALGGLLFGRFRRRRAGGVRLSAGTLTCAARQPEGHDDAG